MTARGPSELVRGPAEFVRIRRVLPAAFAGATVYAERSLVITTTAAGELCASVDGGDQVLDRDDVRRLIAALEMWLDVRFEITAAGRAAAAHDEDGGQAAIEAQIW